MLETINMVSARAVRWLLHPFIKMTVLPDSPADKLTINANESVVYVMRSRSYIHIALLVHYCKKLNLPSPLQNDGKRHFVFLSKPFGFFNRNAKLPVHEERLRAFIGEQKNHENHRVQFIPVSFYWGRNPGRENSVWRLLFSDKETATLFQRIFIILLQGRNSFLNFGEPVDLTEIVKKGSVEANARKVARVCRVYFHRQRIAAMGPEVSQRKVLLRSILASDAVKAAIKREMSTKNLTFNEAKGQARKHFYEVSADYNYVTIRFFAHFLSWLWNRLYRGIEVHNQEKLREVAGEHELVFVPSHRSHMDYLLMSYVLYHEGLMIPHIAAGINLNFWPVGRYLRQSGAFFMRRSFRGNKLYTAVFNEYLHSLFDKGYSVEYFVEGGRSRTGKLLQPKTGMLAMTLQSALQGTRKPVLFVPVYIGYDNVVEVKSYYRELLGDQKQKESVGQLLGMRKALKRSYGKVQVSFGKPLSLLQFVQQEVKDFEPVKMQFDEKPVWFTQLVSSLAKKIMGRINQAASASSAGLISMVLLDMPRYGMDKLELQNQLGFYLKLLKKVPYSDHTIINFDHADSVIEQAKDVGALQSAPHPLGEILFLSPKDAVHMNYYRANILHLFCVPSLVAACFVNKEQLTLDEILNKIEKMYPFFQADLFLPWDNQALTNIIKALLNEFIYNELITFKDAVYRCRPAASFESIRLHRLAKLVMPSLQKYAITLSLLSRAEDSIERKSLEKQSQNAAQRISILHAANNPMDYDKESFKQLITWLKDFEFVKAQGTQLIPQEALESLKDNVFELLTVDVAQSIHLVLRD
ncbi:MAG: glycerol-3-phosphate 1-O-acyltransferase PlsB [Pseudomonadota bacterium]